MDELLKLNKSLSNLVTNWEGLIKQFILDFEPDFIDIVNSQLDKGIDGDGDNLFPNYNIMYNEFKKSIGSLSAPIPDLKVTGDWREGMRMGEDFNIFSTDFKDSILHKKYGAAITELQTKNLNVFIKDQIIPEFEVFIHKRLRL